MQSWFYRFENENFILPVVENACFRKILKMKTIKILFTVLAVAVVAIANAVEKPRLNFVPLNADQAIVSISNEKEALMELSILSEDGEIVYFKQSAKPLSSYKKVFDFEELENGNYVMNLNVNGTRMSREFGVASNEITIGELKLRIDPYFDFTDNALKLSYLNHDNENMKLTIYGKQGVLYQSELGNDFSITTGYDLTKLAEGSYEVVLSSGQNEFTYSLVR